MTITDTSPPITDPSTSSGTVRSSETIAEHGVPPDTCRPPRSASPERCGHGTTRSSRRTRSRSSPSCTPASRGGGTTGSPTDCAAGSRSATGTTRSSATTRAHIREDAQWRVAGAGPGLEDRRVEITGPTDPKMTINALNSGAKVWLADQEDATSPTWRNVIEGQLSLRDAIRGELEFTSPGSETAPGKRYAVTAEQTPTIVMRPRGWHLTEAHLRFTDRTGRELAASGSLVDFGLYFFHNAAELIASGRGPYFYLAKLESSEEAKLWDDVFTFSERYIGIPHGTIRATVLIETLPAAFEMEEILFELRDHCAGLNAGRWDYIFSIIKNYRGRGARFVLPDRSEVTMTVPFMRAYTDLLVQTCHKRGAFAIGGMSAFIPNRRDPEVTRAAFEKVAADKKREAGDGFDGTWVAHPDLIPVARAEFDAVLGDRPNQVDRQRPDVEVTAADLLDVHIGRADHGDRRRTRTCRSPSATSRRGCGAGRRRDRQPDGGRGDRRDLTIAGVAVDPPGPHDRRRHPDHPRLHRRAHRPGARRGGTPPRATDSRTPPRSSVRLRWGTTSPRS